MSSEAEGERRSRRYGGGRRHRASEIGEEADTQLEAQIQTQQATRRRSEQGPAIASSVTMLIEFCSRAPTLGAQEVSNTRCTHCQRQPIYDPKQLSTGACPPARTAPGDLLPDKSANLFHAAFRVLDPPASGPRPALLDHARNNRSSCKHWVRLQQEQWNIERTTTHGASAERTTTD